ncbi:hypothetical protein NPIL_355151 [Nephila pilipes]|uniref:Uncharacterized protein n=1 Tax=Nephila pilipes TaxID=299642 RepID=A0A8X6NCG7_NEPPI|nr:hypothetical protein NPIL_355151 [Nephila pilipes]
MAGFYQRAHGLEVIATRKMKQRDNEKRVTESVSLSVIEVTFEFEMGIYNGRHSEKRFLQETCSISVVKSSLRHHKKALKEAYQNFRLFFVEEKCFFFVLTVMNCFGVFGALCLQ